MIKILLVQFKNYKLNLFLMFKKYICIQMMTKLLLFTMHKLVLLFKIKLQFLRARLPKHQLQIPWLNILNIYHRHSSKESKIQHHLLLNRITRLISRNKFRILIRLIKTEFNNILIYICLLLFRMVLWCNGSHRGL